VQALWQQNPSAQNPDWHSPADVQAAPSSRFVMQAPPTHDRPAAHPPSPLQVVAQASPAHW
jgi:hypothetical protein